MCEVLPHPTAVPVPATYDKHCSAALRCDTSGVHHCKRRSPQGTSVRCQDSIVQRMDHAHPVEGFAARLHSALVPPEEMFSCVLTDPCQI